jgi:large subunit ribosomal protein L25
MQTIEIKATKRENLGKAATKELRATGNVPAVLYGGSDVVHFYAAEKEIKKLIFTPNVYLIKVSIDGKTYDAIIKDLQFHPVKDDVMHIDFLQISEDKPVIIEIPIKLEGLAEGVKAGGKLTLEQRKLRVKGLPKDLPDTLNINISSLGLGKGMQVAALSFANLELLNAKNSVVVSVKLTRAARAAAQQKG